MPHDIMHDLFFEGVVPRELKATLELFVLNLLSLLSSYSITVWSILTMDIVKWVTNQQKLMKQL